MLERRKLLTRLGAGLLFAPAIVSAGSLMKIRPVRGLITLDMEAFDGSINDLYNLIPRFMITKEEIIKEMTDYKKINSRWYLAGNLSMIYRKTL